jgi:hypothetical protein
MCRVLKHFVKYVYAKIVNCSYTILLYISDMHKDKN